MKELLEKAAAVLAGRSVSVFVRSPVISGVRGVAFLSEDGEPVVEIKPGLSPGDLLHVLAHECGHVKFGHAQTFISEPKPGIYSNLVAKARRNISECVDQENQADQYAERWCEFAEQYAERFDGDWLECRLKAIANYELIRTEIMINSIAEKAVEKVYKKYGLKGGGK